MVTITETGKNKNYRYQMISNIDTRYSTMYLLCDDCKARITRYLFGRTSNMDLFASQIGKLDSVVCMYQDERRRIVDVFDIADTGDLVSYAHRMAIADACGAVEFGSFNYVPGLYAEELNMALGDIPVEEIVVENSLCSFRERVMRRH